MFRSILFCRPEQRAGVDQLGAPAFFRNLNLDQVIESITAGREEYDLKPFFNAPLDDVEAVNYRHEVLHDLEGQALGECTRSFAQRMRTMRAHLAQADKLRYQYQKASWFLDAVEIYTEAVRSLSDDLAKVPVGSRGLRGFRDYLADHVGSEEFTSLVSETAQRKDDLVRVRYSLLIRTDRITVSTYDAQADYAAAVEETFEKFKRGAVKDYRVRFGDDPDMNHVEAGVLERVALLFPYVFAAFDEYCDRHRYYLDQTIADFDREVQFYLAYLEYVQRFRSAGLAFCYPRVSDRSKEVHATETFDVALANKLVPQHSPVVCNDLDLKGLERIFVVSGPNQGGKTTFARMFGQLHYLASLGCPVPGTGARLFLYDQMFAHFEREETITNLRGKLHDDLVRIRTIVDQATPNSIVIMNEIFSSTTLQDAVFLSKQVMARMDAMDVLGVWVTFLDEMASFSEKTVSVVSTIDPQNPAVRTFKLERRPADGLAYAHAIAEKYRVTYNWLEERIQA